MYDINKVRQDFPILSRTVYDKPLVYLDNAATTQKPLCVLDAMRDEYLNVNANVHRGVHYLSQQATDLHEAARETVRKFINAPKIEEIIFTRGTTESLNLVVSSFCDEFMSEGDEVIISTMEHHSNIVPWQLQAAKKGIAIRVIPINDKGEINLDEFTHLFTNRTKIVSIAQVSNVLGTVNPVKEMIKIAHEHDVPVIVDGAQSTPHFAVDVQDLDCDFFAFSGHKIYGPTGIGVLYGKEEWLDKLPPYQGGGEMIESVSFEKTTFEKLPFKFEAGTPDYVATHGLAKAIDYVSALGMDNIAKHEQELTRYCMEQMKTIDGIRLFGEQEGKDAVVSFLVGDIHHMDMGTLLDRLGIAVRTGHHCAQPLMDRYGILGTVRASFALYNTKEEVDALVAGVKRVAMMFLQETDVLNQEQQNLKFMLESHYYMDKIEAGCDEAGRGCLAGSVYAAAVILPPGYQNPDLNDSKKLTDKKRKALREQIERDAVAWAVGVVTPDEIDKINILNASFLAMHRALDQLKVRPEAIIVDGNRFKPYKDLPYTTIVKGDGKYMSIAAASILAKTYRDDYMDALAEEYPQYDWKANKGYPTKKHRAAIKEYGVTPYHRMSYNLLGSGELSLDFKD